MSDSDISNVETSLLFWSLNNGNSSDTRCQRMHMTMLLHLQDFRGMLVTEHLWINASMKLYVRLACSSEGY